MLRYLYSFCAIQKQIFLAVPSPWIIFRIQIICDLYQILNWEKNARGCPYNGPKLIHSLTKHRYFSFSNLCAYFSPVHGQLCFFLNDRKWGHLCKVCDVHLIKKIASTDSMSLIFLLPLPKNLCTHTLQTVLEVWVCVQFS